MLGAVSGDAFISHDKQTNKCYNQTNNVVKVARKCGNAYKLKSSSKIYTGVHALHNCMWHCIALQSKAKTEQSQNKAKSEQSRQLDTKYEQSSAHPICLVPNFQFCNIVGRAKITNAAKVESDTKF